MSARFEKLTKKYFSLGMVLTTLGVVSAAVVACTESAKAKPNVVHQDQPPRPGVVAKIGDQEYTLEQFIGDDKMDFFELRKREYELKMERLHKLMIEKLVGDEAKKANMSVEDFVNKKIVGGELKINDKEFNKFVAEKHIPESQLNPQIRERINNYLQSSKKQQKVDEYLAKLTKNTPVIAYFEKPKMNIKIEPGNGPIAGKADAKVTIVEFSDFQCPFCARGGESVEQLRKKYGNKVAIYFRQFPLPMHKDARPTSEASLCVNEQGSEKFWKFHDLAFKNQDKLTAENFEKWAKESGADPKKFKECFDAKKYADAVQKDLEYGEKLGVRSTPTFFVNGQLVNGAVPIEQFSEMIDEELKNADKK